MDYYEWQETVINLVSLAREQISLARLARQEAQFAEDMQQMMGIRPINDDIVLILRKSAKLMRCKARETLQKVEIENGKMFFLGEDPLRLKEWLDGRNFRNWLEYKKVYVNSHHKEEARLGNPYQRDKVRV